MLDTIVIARHGDYDPDTGALDDAGIASVQRLADTLKSRLVLPVIIMTSPIQRARETAELLATLLPSVIGVRECDGLAEYGNAVDSNCSIDNAVADATDQAATVVLVTHDQVAHEYVNHRLRCGFGLDNPRHFQLHYGAAFVVHVDGQIEMVR